MSLAPALLFPFRGQKLWLLPEKAIFWEDTATLLVADVHLGKVAHFRKAGLAVPAAAALRDFSLFDLLLATYPVKRLLVLGDLFHSTANAANLHFATWLDNYPHLHLVLVKGNHDLLPPAFYEHDQITVYPETLTEFPFVFSHIPLDSPANGYNLAGHLHPAVRLGGRGRQMMQLPCFYFGKSGGLLPAFGGFTGLAAVPVEAGDAVFAVIPNQVITVSEGLLD